MIEIKIISDNDEVFEDLHITPDVKLGELCRCLWRLENSKAEILELINSEFKPSTKFSSEENNKPVVDEERSSGDD